MIASRDNLIAARAVGVRVHRARLLAFTVCGFLTGVGGCLLGHQIGTVSPNAFYFTTTFNIIIMVVLGGLGSISGAVIRGDLHDAGARVAAEPGDECHDRTDPLGRRHSASRRSSLRSIFIAVMILRPSGLMGSREIDLAGWLRESGRRSKIERSRIQTHWMILRHG